jgi:GABA(A) receptor-associated protein
MKIFNELNLLLTNHSADECKTTSKSKTNWSDYKISKTFELRLKECELITSKYKNKVPIIINECSDELKDRVNRKMLLQKEITVGNYMYLLRNKFNIKSEESIVMFINGKIPVSTMLMGYLYEIHKDKDGFLYISILKENVFG